MDSQHPDLNDFYQKKLAKLGLKEVQGKKVALIVEIRHLPFLPRFLPAKVVGLVFEKPKQTKDGVIGIFSASARWSDSPVHHIATELKNKFRCEIKIEINSSLPA